MKCEWETWYHIPIEAGMTVEIRSSTPTTLSQRVRLSVYAKSMRCSRAESGTRGGLGWYLKRKTLMQTRRLQSSVAPARSWKTPRSRVQGPAMTAPVMVPNPPNNTSQPAK